MMQVQPLPPLPGSMMLAAEPRPQQAEVSGFPMLLWEAETTPDQTVAVDGTKRESDWPSAQAPQPHNVTVVLNFDQAAAGFGMADFAMSATPLVIQLTTERAGEEIGSKQAIPASSDEPLDVFADEHHRDGELPLLTAQIIPVPNGKEEWSASLAASFVPARLPATSTSEEAGETAPVPPSFTPVVWPDKAVQSSHLHQDAEVLPSKVMAQAAPVAKVSPPEMPRPAVMQAQFTGRLADAAAPLPFAPQDVVDPAILETSKVERFAINAPSDRSGGSAAKAVAAEPMRQIKVLAGISGSAGSQSDVLDFPPLRQKDSLAPEHEGAGAGMMPQEERIWRAVWPLALAPLVVAPEAPSGPALGLAQGKANSNETEPLPDAAGREPVQFFEAAVSKVSVTTPLLVGTPVPFLAEIQAIARPSGMGVMQPVPDQAAGLTVTAAPPPDMGTILSMTTAPSASAPHFAERSPPVLPVHLQVSQALAGMPLVTELQLSPQELGHVRIEMQQDGERLMVLVTAERPETLELLRRHAPDLSAELRNAGHSTLDLSFGRWAGPGHDGAQDGVFEPQLGSPEPQGEVAVVTKDVPPARQSSALGGLYLRI
ncbi:flagellar hook-length control protein FliK [Xinfangfangia sp. CPCC 101601]|uniref:Flagellar hook-length control protein FliK n=1 Tax=Pseudogemmobacter lacusdianii TaxID=3069608 RepID=A0ABU0VWL2_9RHOB|nr:flagellar hook-length control protein FliK [Xinfangfangia sp. CPCC 101601]MDQ2065310.1 flagellar hook-length control protein FliK [Xinfangfangia sp. CPCC 101601]